MCEFRDDEKELRYILKDGGGVPEAGKSLCSFIDERYLLDSAGGPRRPLVVLAFDEPQLEIWIPACLLESVFRAASHSATNQSYINHFAVPFDSRTLRSILP
jgi:hypothetical protein